MIIKNWCCGCAFYILIFQKYVQMKWHDTWDWLQDKPVGSGVESHIQVFKWNKIGYSVLFCIFESFHNKTFFKHTASSALMQIPRPHFRDCDQQWDREIRFFRSMPGAWSFLALHCLLPLSLQVVMSPHLWTHRLLRVYSSRTQKKGSPRYITGWSIYWSRLEGWCSREGGSSKTWKPHEKIDIDHNFT